MMSNTTDTNQASEDKRPIFKLLWNMQNEIERNMSERGTGTIISRYASMIDDRIENSGYSRSIDSLKLYTTEQLEEELKERKGGGDA